MAKVKVWGMALPARSCAQARAIVAVTSQRKAAAAFGVSLHELRGYACITGNQEEIRTAMAAPGTVFSRPLADSGADFFVGKI